METTIFALQQNLLSINF